MDIVKYEQAALHTRGVNHREGSFRYKDLGQGTPGRPENFYLRMVWTEGDFFSPRHMHNFDQVRVQIKGKFSFDKDGTMQPGCIGYFPEGTPYGPQASAEDTGQLASSRRPPKRVSAIRRRCHRAATLREVRRAESRGRRIRPDRGARGNRAPRHAASRLPAYRGSHGGGRAIRPGELMNIGHSE